jgi:hypothetical protein
MADAKPLEKPLEKNVKLGVIALVAVALIILLPIIVSQEYILLLIPLLMIGLGGWRLYKGGDGRLVGLVLLCLGVFLFLIGGTALKNIGTKMTTAIENAIDDNDGTTRTVVGGNGIITIRPGGTESFLVDGTVAIRNYRNYCIEVSPRGVFKMDETQDARIIYIEPRLRGETVLATVTSKRAEHCGHH